MNRRKLLFAALALGVAVVGWALFRPELLFVNQRVNEELVPSEATSARATSEATTSRLAPAEPGAGPLAVSRGSFHSVAHETRGTATVYELEAGRHVVRLTNFATSNGPDVHVYLVPVADAKDDATVTRAGFVDLGSLKGNVGDQNYDLPAGFDHTKPMAVTIWCKRFGVNFGTAPIAPVS